MSRAQVCVYWHKYTQMIIYLLILFASNPSFTHIGLMAEGRAISKLIEANNQKGILKEEGSVVVGKAQILGSRPPKCEIRCRNCGHCEAVQVPVVPQVQVQSHGRRRSHSDAATREDTPTITYYSRGDDLSNYKPMGWKCRCGNHLFNP